MALPQKKGGSFCTLFWLPLLTQPASPVMRKMVLEDHFEYFILLLSAALIHVSVQSVGPNPLMNVFFWGFHMAAHSNWKPWTAGWQRVLFYPALSDVRVWKARFFFTHIRDDTVLNRNDGETKSGKTLQSVIFFILRAEPHFKLPFSVLWF